ncbi:MAG: PAS domain S-box protein, partial [Anaerolineales bacterium]|nr:PAS domain S-box protein [Anaerolineales bacterium]
MFTPKSTVHQTLSRARFKMLTPSNAPKRPPKTFFYRQIFNANPAIMLVIDPEDGRIIEGNQAACQYYGYDAQTLARMYIHQINTLTLQEVKEEMYLAYTLQKNLFNFKHRLSTGEIREVEVYSGPIQVRGKPLLYSIIHDITPLKMAEIALRESERKYLQVIEHVDASICVVQDEKFVFGNHIFFEWLGITPNPFSPLSIQT